MEELAQEEQEDRRRVVARKESQLYDAKVAASRSKKRAYDAKATYYQVKLRLLKKSAP